MIKWICSLVFAFLAISGTDAQDSMFMRRVAQYDNPTLPTAGGDRYNDVWGFAGYGREIAILGNARFILFIDVTDENNIFLLHQHDAGENTIWRDFKSYGNYVYAVSDGTSEGLLIFDMSNVPNSVSLAAQNTTHFQNAHNIFIDVPNGKLYTADANTLRHGTIVLDLAANPTNPPVWVNADFQTIADDFLMSYALHDVFVKNNIVYGSHGYTGYHIWDFSDVNNIVHLGGFDPIGSGYNHSSWNNDTDTYAVYAEEIPAGRPITVIDISNPAFITQVATWKDPLLSPLENNVPHNPYIKNDTVYCSYYEDGVQVIDITNKAVPQRVAYFDLSPNAVYGGYNNTWGVYPYLPSGKILASDQTYGLLVLRVDFTVVPVELTRFDATIHRTTQSRLTWETASEVNNSHFVVERSRNGHTYSGVARIPGHGNSNAPQSYEFIDEQPFQGLNYYRLKQVDLNGDFEYSPVRTVAFEKMNIDVTVLSNPVSRPHFSFRLHQPLVGDYDVSLVDISGKEVYRQSFDIVEPVTNVERVVSVSYGQPGIYFLRITHNNDLLFTEKISLF